DEPAADPIEDDVDEPAPALESELEDAPPEADSRPAPAPDPEGDDPPEIDDDFDEDDPELDDDAPTQPDPKLRKMYSHGDPNPFPRDWLIKRLMTTVGHGVLAGQWAPSKLLSP